jgi:hypothetical protein
VPKHRNGPLHVGDLTPEIIPALVIERDGREVVLRGYVSGPRCPGRVKAQMAAIGRRYNEATTVTVEPGVGDSATDLNTQTVFRHDPVAYREYLHDAIDTCVIGLEDIEADVLAGDEDRVNSVLRYLSWLPDEDDEEEADADPEVKGEASTSENSSPSSQPSTDSELMSS